MSFKSLYILKAMPLSQQPTANSQQPNGIALRKQI
jgi:hypothetical protein